MSRLSIQPLVELARYDGNGMSFSASCVITRTLPNSVDVHLAWAQTQGVGIFSAFIADLKAHYAEQGITNARFFRDGELIDLPLNGGCDE
ncbi:hypothetical protein [Neptunomonas sp. XY-337]|uniref:hypothetical protein n=1 Tax=Neptunomonas sp. XY-337 TaxID=2561897 RepID=UPI0010A99976|nr:hypothetical protein [Neptunomonas sp. XY-337]